MAFTESHSYNDGYDTGDLYLHYYLVHAPGDVSSVWGAITDVKASIARSYAEILSKRRQQLEPFTQISSQDEKVIVDLLSGDMFENLGNMWSSKTFDFEAVVNKPKQTNAPLGLYSQQEVFQYCETAVSELNTKVDAIQNFITELTNVIQKISNIAPSVLKKYGQYILKEAAKQTHKTGLLKHSSNFNKINQVKESILQALLGKYNERFFKLVATDLNLPVEVVKMIAMVEALPSAEDSSIKFVARTGSGNSMVSKNLEDTNQIEEIVQNKFYHWLVSLEKKVNEYAHGLVLYQGNSDLFNKLNTAVKISITGNQNVKVSLDPQIEYYGKAAGVKNIKTKRATSDVSVVVGEEEIDAVVGINIKNYKNITTQFDANGMSTISGHFTIKSGTTLLNALFRDAMLSGQEIHSILQFLVGHETGVEGTYNIGSWGRLGSKTSDADLMELYESKTGTSLPTWNFDEQWDILMEYIKYRVFLGALIGLDVWDTSWYISLNGWIYKAADFATRMLVSPESTIKMLENKDSVGGGFDRQSYVALNPWLPPKRKDRIVAARRSQQTETKALSLLRGTKIRIQVNMVQLSGLRALNR